VIIAAIMVFCIVAALALSPTYKEMGFQAFGEEEATNPIWALFYIGLVIVMAVVIILLIKIGFQKFIHIAFLGAVFFTIVFVLTPLVSLALAEDAEWEKVDDVSVFPPPESLSCYINGSTVTWDGEENYVIFDHNDISLYNSTGVVSVYYATINTVIQTDVRGDNRTEIIVGTDQGIKIFDSNLKLKKDMDMGKNITALSSSLVLDGAYGLKYSSIIAGFDGGAVVLIPSGDDFASFDLKDEAGSVPGEVQAVYLGEKDDYALTAYVNTTEGLYYVDIEFSIMPLIVAGGIAGLFGLIAIVLLVFYPEWYVVDITGIILAIGAMTLIGISLSILPLFILLTALAIYDAIAVYRTKHMITMASTVIEMRLPVLLVIPKSLDYTFRDQDKLKKQLERKEKRGALFIGLGDIIIPGTLVISAFTFLGSSTTYFGIGANLLVALCTLVGVLIGYTVLMRFVLKGNPQAGLPLLNSGAIFGYVLGYIIFVRDFTLGFEIPTWGLGF
jgi:presenilin-like A22 family membrane protease